MWTMKNLFAAICLRLTFQLVTSEGDPCSPNGTLVDGRSGNFSSPGFPSDFTNDIICTWKISVPVGHQVELSFSTFSLETCFVPSVCTCDRVEIRNGRSKRSSLIKRLCGKELPSPVRSSGRYMWVKFQTDSTRNGQGFLANFKAIALGPFAVQNAGSLCSDPKHPVSCPSSSAPTCCYDSGPLCCKSGGNRCHDGGNFSRDYCPRSSDDSTKTVCCLVENKPSCCSPAKRAGDDNDGIYCSSNFGWDVNGVGCILITLAIVAGVVILCVCVCVCVMKMKPEYCFLCVMVSECCDCMDNKYICGGCESCRCDSIDCDCGSCDCGSCDCGSCDCGDCNCGDCDCKDYDC